MALSSDGEISQQDAAAWMAENEPSMINTMGFIRPIDDRERRNVTHRLNVKKKRHLHELT